MKVIKHTTRLEISFKFDQRLITLIKTFDGRTYNPSSKSWWIPIAGAMPAIVKLKEAGFSIDPEVLTAVKEDDDKAKETEALTLMEDTEFETTLPLYNFQRVGASFLYQIGSGILGDSPGTGKTLQVLAVAEKAKAEKVLIFTPAAVKYQFASEIEKFLPGNKAVVIDGTVDKRIKLWTTEARFYIANYELLLRDFSHMDRVWDLILADEATKISSPFAKQSKAIKKLRAKRKIAMTGTLISNRANDVWNICDFVSAGSFGNYFNFVSRYCLKNSWGGVFGYQNIDELKSKLRRFMIRRTREEILPELPEKQYVDLPFELSEEEKKLQENIKRELLFEINKYDISKLEHPMTLQNTLVKMTRLRQLADSLELLGENKKSSKVEVLKELLNQIFEER